MDPNLTERCVECRDWHERQAMVFCNDCKRFVCTADALDHAKTAHVCGARYYSFPHNTDAVCVKSSGHVEREGSSHWNGVTGLEGAIIWGEAPACLLRLEDKRLARQ